MRNYNKSDIVTALALQHPELGKQYFQTVVDETLQLIKHFALAGGKVNLTNFGSFKLKKVDSKMTRNPRTGDLVLGKPYMKISFHPSKNFKYGIK